MLIVPENRVDAFWEHSSAGVKSQEPHASSLLCSSKKSLMCLTTIPAASSSRAMMASRSPLLSLPASVQLNVADFLDLASVRALSRVSRGMRDFVGRNRLEDQAHDRDAREAKWQRFVDSTSNEGYRNGFDLGREGGVQEGFDLGYGQGCLEYFEQACLRGIVAASLQVLERRPGICNAQAVQAVHDLVSQMDGTSIERSVAPVPHSKRRRETKRSAATISLESTTSIVVGDAAGARPKNAPQSGTGTTVAVAAETPPHSAAPRGRRSLSWGGVVSALSAVGVAKEACATMQKSVSGVRSAAEMRVKQAVHVSKLDSMRASERHVLHGLGAEGPATDLGDDSESTSSGPSDDFM